MSNINEAPDGAPGGFHLPTISEFVDLTAARHPRLVLAGTVGLLLVGGHAVINPSDPVGLKTQPAKAHGQQHKGSQPEQSKHKSPRTDCSTFRIAANDIYAGSGCGKQGATAETIGDGHLEKGWVYSAIVTGGVKKCFFVQKGKLPRPKKPDPNHIAACASFYPKLVEQKYTYLRKYNCKFFPSGLQRCRSGTFYTPIVSTCRANVVYRNYATADATPWNANGKAPAGFSDRVKNSEDRKAVSYRVEIRDRKRNGHKAGAVVIRGLKRQHGWGLMDVSCPKQNMLRGGVPTFSK